MWEYALVDTDNKTIVTLYETHPGWLNDNGEPLSDEELKSHNVFKIDYDTKKPEYDEFTQQLSINKEVDWIIDFDKGIIYVTYKVVDILLDTKKQEIAGLIRESFINEFKIGKFKSSLGFVTDCRRYDIYNDPQNLNGLIELAQQTQLQTIEWKDANGQVHQLTLDQAKTLLKEMGLKILWNYQHKWDKLSQLESIKTYDELKKFKVWEPDSFYDYLAKQTTTDTSKS